MSKKKKTLTADFRRAHNERSVANARRAEVGYPSAYEVLARPELVARVRASLRGVAALGLVIAGAGCAEPTCTDSALGELRVHGGEALSDVVHLEIGAAVDQIGVGTGITPHPVPVMMGGAVAIPSPYLPPPPGGSGTGFEE
jgi:hypothetical protein